MVDTDYAVTTAGSAFSFRVGTGDTINSATEVTTTTGNVDDLLTYGEVVTGSGGVKIGATALSSGIMTVTAGGAGTSAILSNKMELEID